MLFVGDAECRCVRRRGRDIFYRSGLEGLGVRTDVIGRRVEATITKEVSGGAGRQRRGTGRGLANDGSAGGGLDEGEGGMGGRAVGADVVVKGEGADGEGGGQRSRAACGCREGCVGRRWAWVLGFM
ncbi:uncharacterized protein A4U43_C03F20570 [Asparagus officinalis]|uniref:Uncharacterized protein n=1 Tax=Asparagus officinalis TaxID=4686 RepID=A0A5P1FFY2_ASPOF|nr:uncharacterized protein A4U43_C03F20570 [Asparagus officinalis]